MTGTLTDQVANVIVTESNFTEKLAMVILLLLVVKRS